MFFGFADVYRVGTCRPTAPIEFVFPRFGHPADFLVGWDKVAGAQFKSVIEMQALQRL